MLKIENLPTLHRIIADAIVSVHKTAQSRERRNRWINALASATFRIETHPQFMEWNAETKVLTIWSESGEFYTVSSGKCQCKAFEQKQPCDHRATYKILSMYFVEIEPKRERVNLSHQNNNAPYLKPTGQNLNTMAGVRY